MKYIKIFVLLIILVTSCTIEHPADKRLNDTVGILIHNNVSININYGTHKIDTENNLIISRAQTPSIVLNLKESDNQSQTLNFQFSNMRYGQLPQLTPNRGVLTMGSELGVVDYSITLTPNEAITITLDNFPKDGDYRFGTVGDIHYNETIGEKIATNAATQHLDFFIVIGDFVHIPSNKQYAWALALTKKFNVPVYVVFGNHDDNMGGYDGYSRFREIFGRTNYSFTHKNDLFLILDSAEQSMSRDGFTFAENQLKNFKGDNRFIFLHVPPFDEYGMRNNSFSSRYQATRLFNMMLKYKVNISFAGHIHTYQDFDMAGIRNLIIGTGGGRPEKLDGVGYRYIIIERTQDKYKIETIDIQKD